MSNDFGWIDLHHHIIPSDYVKALAEIGITELSGIPIPKWRPKKSLTDMDKLGIDKAVLSAPLVYFKDNEFSRKFARTTNIYLAELIKTYPSRYGGLASVPLPDIDGAFEELEYAFDELHLDGVTLLSNSKGMYLGDPELEEFFAELNRRKAVVFIHPHDPPFAHIRKPDVPVMFLEWPFDTTRAVTNMVYSGVLDRYPHIRYILSHGGGTVPYLAWRISVLEYRQRDKTKVLRSLYDLIIRKQGPITGMKLLQKMYYDTTAVTAQSSLSALNELLDPSHIVLGTDLGAAPKLMASLILRDLQTFDGFNEEDLISIARKGALELFPRLASV
ncbi:MAG: amidohydrolase family protein [Candidatus Hermodarchaeota archaeon]|nr:amidohydrolase family protein [Candidatus Hermodarchaeota archaeon]